MLTLVEAAKLSATNGETKRAAVIAMFAQASQWLMSLAFKDIPGNAYAYNREGTLPGVAFRGVNEAYTESTGVINPLVEALRIAGGDLDVDTAILKTQGEGVRATHEAMKVKALAAEFTRVLIKGDSTSNPREPDGLQVRITGSQLVENGASSGGDVLSLAQLDAAIDQCANPTAIWLPKLMRRRLTQASRNTSTGGFLVQTKDDFGRPLQTYNGLPLLTAYPDNGGTEPITYTEVGSGGGTAQSASLYVVGVGDGYFSGIQNGVMDVRDLGELQTTPAKRTRVEWLASICVEHGRSVVRLRGIKDGAVVA
ncbi:MAG TPA: hypothetical protein VGM50_22960 [Gemmatimonadaceae bacterium]|jgi:hypothetical protein